MDKASKQKYKSDFAIMSELLNSFDPCGLISGGAPKDEYESLSQKLVSSFYQKKSLQEIKDIIIHEIENFIKTPDFTTLDKPYKTLFYNEFDKLLDELETKFYTPRK